MTYPRHLTIVHEVLFGKLYGFSTLALLLDEVILAIERKQRVNVFEDNKTCISGWQELTVGVIDESKVE